MPVEESRYMEPLQLAGRLIMENGGETYRAEETITRMGKAFGLQKVESFAVPSGLFISYRRTDGANETSVARVRKGPRNLSRVDAVNDVSRRAERGELDCEAALACLEKIKQSKPLVSRRMAVIAAGISGAGFTGMFGGSWGDVAISFAVAALVQAMAHLLERFHMHDMVSPLGGSLITTLIPLLISHFAGFGSTEAIIGGALMPLLPGLAMTNAVQDAMRGDMVSGLSHGLSAVLTAMLVAGGALVASGLVSMMGGAAL